MRTLSKYLRTKGAKSLTALSVEVGVSKGRLSQLRDLTEWPPELALKIEAATGDYLNAASLSKVVADARRDRAA